MTSIDSRPATDITWRCSSGGGGNEWYKLDFDDSGWDQPHIIGTNTNPVSDDNLWDRNDNFPDHAEWIWKDVNYDNEYTTSYCRGTLGKLSPHYSQVTHLTQASLVTPIIVHDFNMTNNAK